MTLQISVASIRTNLIAPTLHVNFGNQAIGISFPPKQQGAEWIWVVLKIMRPFWL